MPSLPNSGIGPGLRKRSRPFPSTENRGGALVARRRFSHGEAVDQVAA
jgi:hypothetical protein